MSESRNERIISEAQERYAYAESREHDAKQKARDDRRFANGDAYNHDQWDDAIWRARNPAGGAARPCLTINKTRQHILQITNDALQNQMGIKANAVGFGSTAEAATAIEGIIRHIEYASNAQQNAYKSAFRDSVQCGIGYFLLETDYLDARSFDQDVFIKAVKDPLAASLDPDCLEPDKSDARWAFLGSDVPRKTFEREHPQFKEAVGVAPLGSDADTAARDWSTSDHVRVMEYWWVEDKTEKRVMHPEKGAMARADLDDDEKKRADDEDWRSRDVADKRVMWCQIAGSEIIAGPTETVWDYLPLIPVIPEEVVIDGKIDRKSHTRALIDSARMYNYNRSAEVEYAAGLAKTQFMGDARILEGYESYWDTRNIRLHSFLPIHGTDENGAPLPPPTPVEPPQSAEAFRTGAEAAANDMQLVSGQYQSEMGAPSNERSGVAITQRQRQGDTATYHYTDAMGAALRLAGRNIIAAIPRVYDTQRAVMVLSEDGERKGVVIDPSLPTAHQTVQPPPGMRTPTGEPPDAIMAINPTIGRYDVEADVGPSYGTRRQEAFEAISEVLRAAPELVQRIGDLLFKAGDFPMADQIAERLAPPGDDPQAAAAGQQIQQLQTELQTAQQALKNKAAEQQIAIEKIKVDVFKAITDRLVGIGSIDQAALIPVIRDLVGQVFQTDIVPIAHGHDPSMGGSGVPPPEMGGPMPPDTRVPPVASANPPGGATIGTGGQVQ